MSIGGELNGTTCLLYKGIAGTEVIAGQMEFTITYGGTPIDISNKSCGDWLEFLDGELAAKQVVISGTLVYNNTADYEAIKDQAFTGTMDNYVFKFAPSTESLAGKFMPNAMSETVPHGDKVSTSITFSSSGEVTRTGITVA